MIFCMGTTACAEKSAVSATPTVADSETAQMNCETNSRNTTDQNAAKQEVYAAYEAITRAMIDKDRATMEKYFDKDLKFRHMSGKVQTREEFIGEIMDGTLNYYKITTERYNIDVSGDTAYMDVTHTLTAKVYGMSGAWTLSSRSKYLKRKGIWIRVNEE